MIYEVEYQYDEGMLPDENSVNVCQLHAEMDLWASRYKLAKAALKLAVELRECAETYRYGEFCCKREAKWEKAVAAIEKKAKLAKEAYENYFTELKVH
jgi:hypothetical protein